jgi:hypothetical protein
MHELVPAAGKRFKLRGLQSPNLDFKLNGNSRVNEAVFRQPNCDFAVKRE